jgi:phosphoribosyl 1,2-cyclic phosphodiesterase
MHFSTTFWGVRGSVACPGPDTIRYGGNTSCIEVRCDDYSLVFDAGTGMRGLGDALLKTGRTNVDVFLSHTHLDHVSGFPFFRPAYTPGNRIKIHAGHLLPESCVREQIEKLMSQPLFPVTLDIMAAELVFIDFRAGETLQISPEITLRTAPLNHPNGATGYRIEFDGKSVCYVTDTEHVPGRPDQHILKLIEGSDLFIYDCTYTDETFPRFVGWGHSTWQEGARLATMAGVKNFAVFHHDPSHTDQMMDAISVELHRFRPASFVAREGMTVEL